jgi:hypothetical protein
MQHVTIALPDELSAALAAPLDSPEKWVQWWKENRSNLVVSEDRLKLVIKRR